MRLASVLLAVSAVLVLAAPAAAKEMTMVEVCGPAGCAATTDEDELRLFGGGSDTFGTRPPMSAFYELNLSATGEGAAATTTWTIYYVPSANMIAVDGEHGTTNWHPLSAGPARVLQRLVARVDPYPAPKITSVAIGDRVVREDAASYGRLLDTTGGTSPHNVSPDDWVGIDLRSARPSPWTDGTRELLYSPSTNILERGDRLVLADGIAADIEAARPLADDGVRWLPWIVVAALAAALLALAALGGLLRRRAVPGLPEPAA